MNPRTRRRRVIGLLALGAFLAGCQPAPSAGPYTSPPTVPTAGGASAQRSSPTNPDASTGQPAPGAMASAPPAAALRRELVAQALANDDAGRDHTTAMQDLASAAQADPSTAPALWLEVAERELRAGNATASADAAANGLSSVQSRALKTHLLDTRVRALAARGDARAAFEAHRQMLTLATSRATLGEDLFRLAQVSRDLGERDAAVQALRTALDQFPSATTTADALRLADELGASAEIDAFILGRARYMAGDYRNAVAALTSSLNADPDGPDAAAARLYKALALLMPGNENAALRDLDAIAADPNSDSDLATQALLEGGQALERLNLPDAAESRYARLLVAFPRSDAAATGAFRLGLLRYTRGDDAAALAAWDTLIARRDNLASADLARALYWRAKTLTRLGRQDDAASAWSDAAVVKPGGLYTLQAAIRAGKLSASGSDGPITADEDTSLIQWLADRHQDVSAAAAAVSVDPALARAESDARLGLIRQGNWEADEIIQRNIDRADRLYAAARRFADNGLTGGAARLGQAAYAAASVQTPSDAPIALRKIAFPRPFADLTAASADAYGLDPLLVEATLREASAFDPWAERVGNGAQGLALTTPVHTDEVAYATRSNVRPQAHPARAIEAQSWLLADRLRRFDNRPEVALAALASSERSADAWLTRAGVHDPDVFLESLDDAAVRNDVQTVLVSRLTYALTYTVAAPLDAFAVARVKSEPTAVWIKIARVSATSAGEAPLSPPLDQASSPGTEAQRDGDYEAATSAFRPLIANPDPVIASGANLRLGQALLAGGRLGDAVAPLQAADKSTPAGSPSAGTFLLGKALAGLERCPDAVAAFDRFATTAPPALAAQARDAAVDCLLTLKRSEDAVTGLKSAIATPDIPRLQALTYREHLALTYARAGDVEAARTTYEGLLAEARSNSYRSELNYDLGVLTGDTVALQIALHLNPRGRAGQAALDELVARDDPLARSIDAATARFEQNRYREALAAYRSILDANPATGLAAQAAYGSGVSLVRLGQDRAGTAILESIADQYPDAPEGADGIFRGGRVRESLGDLAGAEADFARVLGMARGSSRYDDAQFRWAFVAFQEGRIGDAVGAWGDLGSRVTSPDSRAQALFWLAKAQRAGGDETGAQQTLTQAQAADPHGFYGLRAADLLAGRSDPRNAIDADSRSVANDPVGSAAAWADARGDRASAQARIDADPGVGRASILLAMGLRQAAVWELETAQARLSDSPSAVALLGGWEEQRGLYNAALVLGNDLAAAENVSTTAGPVAIRRLIYPLPHPTILVQTGQRVRVDPFLMAGLMRQESVLDATAESAAQARGLSQLVASTAYEAARALGEYDFSSADLFKPKTSIVLGAFTLGQRLTRYEQRVFPALAAYNAAQFAVDGWLQAMGTADLDTFAEAIPFTETYPYVQRIYENTRQYEELYGPR